MKKENRFLTAQQELFLAGYIDPKSATFSNAVQSALKAGYTETYANNITGLMPDWLFESIGDMKRLRRSEKNLTEVQELDIRNHEGKVDTQLVEKRTKVDMFLVERLDKVKYSLRTELTGAGGEAIQIETISPEDKAKLLALL